jgi:hypothetical protein
MKSLSASVGPLLARRVPLPLLLPLLLLLSLASSLLSTADSRSSELLDMADEKRVLVPLKEEEPGKLLLDSRFFTLFGLLMDCLVLRRRRCWEPHRVDREWFWASEGLGTVRGRPPKWVSARRSPGSRTQCCTRP